MGLRYRLFSRSKEFGIRIVIRKKQFKRAVVRNLIRRRIKACLRETKLDVGNRLLVINLSEDFVNDYHMIKADIEQYVQSIRSTL